MTVVITNTIFGQMIVPPYDAYVAQALIRNGQYAPAEFLTWRPYLPPGGVVVDAGANLGAHTLAFAASVGPEGVVHAFEPQRQLFYMLCGSLALCGMRNVHAKHCALGREPGHVRVPVTIDYTAPGNFGSYSPNDEVPPEVPMESVPLIPIDATNLQRLDFLKIDVEGAELGVLMGAEQTIARCKPVMSVEADREKNVPAILAWLRLHGYRAWWHRPPLGEIWPRIVSIDLLALPRDRDLPAPIGYPDGALEEAIP